MIRFRLRTVLIVVSLFALVLPVAGIQVLRLYESGLVRRTESELNAQAVFIAAAFAARFREAAPHIEEHGPVLANPSFAVDAPRQAVLDLARSAIHPPLPVGRIDAAADAVAVRVGLAMTPILIESGGATHADIRVTDHAGIVVAGTGDDLGASLLASEEIVQALRGFHDSRLRRRADGSDSLLAPINRGGVLRVMVSRPIVVDGRVVGAVLLSQVPLTLFDALHQQRVLLMQMVAVMLLVVVAVAIFTSRTVARPIRRLVHGARRIASGEAERLEPVRYRTIEINELAATVASMADSLQWRANYVRELSRSIGHEFKTPIGAMKGTLELLEEHIDAMSVAERTRFLSNLAADVDRLDRLTRRLLLLAQVDMRGRTNASVRLDASMPPASDLELDLELTDEQGCTVPMDAESWRAILRNMAENARQHGASRLRVTARKAGRETIIDVSDDGCGISPANRGQVFKPFFTTHRDEGGTGLGLAIVQALVRNAGGSIACLDNSTGGEIPGQSTPAENALRNGDARPDDGFGPGASAPRSTTPDERTLVEPTFNEPTFGGARFRLRFPLT